MNNVLKDGLFIAAIFVAGFFIWKLNQDAQADREALDVFKKNSQAIQAKLLKDVDSLTKVTEISAQDAQDAREEWKTSEEKLIELIKKQNEEKDNFGASFNGDSLSRYFAERRKNRQR